MGTGPLRGGECREGYAILDQRGDRALGRNAGSDLPSLLGKHQMVRAGIFVGGIDAHFAAVGA
jgi:hypothetical protein